MAVVSAFRRLLNRDGLAAVAAVDQIEPGTVVRVNCGTFIRGKRPCGPQFD
jgi:hypothetical protein